MSSCGRECIRANARPQQLAPRHYDTRFLKIDVTNAPFLVVKLQVQVLPCVLTFIDGVSKDRIVGFEGIGPGTDRFTTRQLEARLLQAGVLLRATTAHAPAAVTSSHDGREADDDDDDDDNDEWD